ncbi:MAG TPA: hypothetical protein VGL92_13590 [Acidimicrobiia bacterium]
MGRFAGCPVAHGFGPGRGGYLYILDGYVRLEGSAQERRPAAAVKDPSTQSVVGDVEHLSATSQWP